MAWGAGEGGSQGPATAPETDSPGLALHHLAYAFEEERPRWFYWVPVFVGFGTSFYFSLPVEPGLALALAVLVAALAIRAAGCSGTFWDILTGILVCAAVGFVAAKVRTELVRAPVLSAEIGPAKVAGFVELIEARGTAGQRLTLRPMAIQSLSSRDLPDTGQRAFSGRWLDAGRLRSL